MYYDLFDGEIKKAQIKSTFTDKIHVGTIKIYIDENGEFVTDYGRIFVFRYEAIVFFSFAVIMLLTAIFTLGAEFMAGSIFAVISFGILGFLLSQIIENAIFSDIVCFISAFTNIGIYMLIFGFISSIISKKENKKLPAYASSNGTSSTNIETSASNQMESQTETIETSKKCKHCGSEVSSENKFCTNCGNKV